MKNKQRLIVTLTAVTILVGIISTTFIVMNQPTEETELVDSVDRPSNDVENNDSMEAESNTEKLEDESPKDEPVQSNTDSETTENEKVEDSKETDSAKEEIEISTEKADLQQEQPEKTSTPKPTISKPEPKKEPVISTKTTTETEMIISEIIEQKDNTLEKGKVVLVQEGVNGVRTITYKETYQDGKFVSKEQVSSKVTKEPIPEIVKVGTKEKPKASNGIPFLTGDKSKSILEKTGLFYHADNRTMYVYENFGNISGIVTTLAIFYEDDHINRIKFDGDGYWPYVYGDPQVIDSNLGSAQPGSEIIKDTEVAVRAAVNAVFGAGTKESNEMYRLLMNGSDPNSDLGKHHTDETITIGGHKVRYYSDNLNVGLKYTEITFLD